VKKHFNINEVYNIDTKKRGNNFLKSIQSIVNTGLKTILGTLI
jgi:hypothetical protein